MKRNTANTLLAILIFAIGVAFCVVLQLLIRGRDAAIAAGAAAETKRPWAAVQTTQAPQAAIPEAPLPAETDPPPAATPVPTPSPRPDRADFAFDAEEVHTGMLVTLDSGADAAALTDADYETSLALPAGTALRLTFPKAVTGLYVIWDEPPGAWSAAAADWTAEYGQYGYIHEFVELPDGTEDLTMAVPEGGILCDLYAYTDGRLPETVQRWTPPLEGDADLLLMPAHGDDEHLFFGGAMPYYAGELGKKVQVVYLTYHWDEQPRPHEQLNGLWTVGVTAYPVFGPFRDQRTDTLADAAAMYGQENIYQFQVEIIRRFKPLVILGHDRTGEYGHGAHRINGSSLPTSVERASDAAYDPESAARYGTWDTPKLYLHLYPYNTVTMNWDVPLEHFGGRTGFEMAEEGYRQHLSQQQWWFYVFPRDSYLSCYDFGLAYTTVGEDVEKDDFFENVPPRSELG